MDTSLTLFWSVLVFLILYALKGEIFNSRDPYTSGIPVESDSLPRLVRKIDYIVQTRSTSVKWRKVLLATTVIVALMFYFIDHEIPIHNPTKVLTYFIIVFVPLYILMMYDCGTELKTLSANSHIWSELMIEKYLSKDIF